MTNRAYSLLEIKAVDEDQRILEGVATTPKTDRMDDVVEPDGAVFKTPLPFLWQHDSRSPIGQVTKAKVSEEGISVRVQLARTNEPGTLKDRLDEAWQAIKIGLVRGLSIGFKAIETTDIKGTFGQRFVKWEWLELSAVTIPANADATIQTIKQFDTGAVTSSRPVVRFNSPGASGHGPRQNGGNVLIADQVKSLEASRAAKHAQRMEIQSLCAKEGRSKNEKEREDFDTLGDEIGVIDAELKDLRVLEQEERATVATAKVVDPTPNGKAASEARGGAKLVVNHPEKLEKGIELARLAMCLAAAEYSRGTQTALQLMQMHYPQQANAINFLKAAQTVGLSPSRFVETALKMPAHMKANVAAGNTTDSVWASPLTAVNTFGGDFLEFLRDATIVDRIQGFRRIPFNVRITGQTSGGTGYWVGEGEAKPVTKFDFNSTTHLFHKVAGISVITEELLRFSDPSAERLVRDGLRDAVVERLDETFIDPTEAASAGVSPASVLNSVAGIASTGDDADAVRADIVNLLEPAVNDNLSLATGVFIMRPNLGLALSLMVNALGGQEFPDVTINGGSLLGFPVIMSNQVPAGIVAFVIAGEIWFSDDGVVTVDASREASLQMLDNPTNSSDAPTPTTLVSLWQTNSVGLRAERFITWTKRRTNAANYLHAVSWGGATS